MNRFILHFIFCCLAVCQAHALDRFTINGTLINANDTDNISVNYTTKDDDGNWQNKIDSCKAINGRFLYSGDIDGITPLVIWCSGLQTPCMFVEPGNITLRMDVNYPYNYELSNVSTWDEQRQYNAALHENDSLYVKEMKFIRKVEPVSPENVAIILPYLDSLNLDTQSKRLSFIQRHLSFKITPGLLAQSLSTSSLDTVKAIYYQLPDQSKSSNLGELLALKIKRTEQLIAKLIADKKRTAIGTNAPLFTRITNTGKTIRLEDYRGKYVMLDFWASWCPPCLKNLPTLKALYDSNKSKSFTVIGLSCDDDEAAWRKAIVTEQLKWDNVLAKQSQVDNLDISDVYNVWSVGIPTYILVDKAGKIACRWNYLGDEETRFIQGLIDKGNEL